MATSMSNGEVAGSVAVPALQSPKDRGASTEDLRLALRAVTLYYLDGLTQAEIAVRLGVSRPTAGRLIARAKAKGLVRIEVVIPPDMRDDLHAEEERELEQRYGLTEAVVAGHGIDVGAPGRPAAFASVGRAAAALLMRRLTPNDVLGFTWGPEQVAVATAMSPGVASCRAVVQLDGAMSSAAYQTGTEFILGRCADVLRATTIRLPAPLYADPSTVASMRSDSLISRTLEAGRRADVMLFGVGAVSTSTTLFEGSFLDTRMLDELDLTWRGGRNRRPVLRRAGRTRRNRTAAARRIGSARRHQDLREVHPDFQWRGQTPRHARRAARKVGAAIGL